MLKIDEVDQKIRATKGNERLEAEFDKMKLPYLDRVSTCEEITAQSMDKVDLLEAKLGLLR